MHFMRSKSRNFSALLSVQMWKKTVETRDLIRENEAALGHIYTVAVPNRYPFVRIVDDFFSEET
uniref:Uncharacterized protein n=1 Tax=Romanomermis culicivorax TaxID=13658 RepID=A0A915L4R3_ROMCU